MDVTFQVCPIKLCEWVEWSEGMIIPNSQKNVFRKVLIDALGERKELVLLSLLVLCRVSLTRMPGLAGQATNFLCYLYERILSQTYMLFGLVSLRCARFWYLMSNDARSLNYSENFKFKKDARINSRFSLTTYKYVYN